MQINYVHLYKQYNNIPFRFNWNGILIRLGGRFIHNRYLKSHLILICIVVWYFPVYVVETFEFIGSIVRLVRNLFDVIFASFIFQRHSL